MVRRRRPGIIIFENVDTYPITLLLQSLGDLYEIRFCKVSPQNFGFAMHRLRVYAILTLRSKVRWTSSLPLEHLLNELGKSVAEEGWMNGKKQQEVRISEFISDHKIVSD